MPRRSRPRPSARLNLLTLVFVIAAAPELVAQIRPAAPTGIRVVREEGIAGALLFAGGPTGDFREFVGANVGVAVFAVKHLGRVSPLGIRFEASAAMYDRDGDWGLGFVNGGVGPQLTATRGPIRPYAFATGGFSLFTPIAFAYDEFEDDVYPFLDFSNADFTLAAVLGGGLLMRLSRGRVPLALDVSAVYIVNGEASYLTANDGRVQSDANVWQLRAGVTVSLY